MLTHILFANLHLGGAWILLSLIILYFISSKERYGHLGRSMALFNVILFSAGATFAAAGVLFFISLYPTFATQGFHIYWWPLLVEAILFGIEILFVYTLWFAWGKVSAAWHIFLGIGYALSIYFQTFAIDTFVSGMLTPAQRPSPGVNPVSSACHGPITCNGGSILPSGRSSSIGSPPQSPSSDF